MRGRGHPSRAFTPSHAVPARKVVAGRCEILGRIAEGGTARVYLATMRGPAAFMKLCALKELRPEFAADTDVRAMFLDEGRLAARFCHPNLVQAHEIIADGESYCIVMEYLEGLNYATLLRGERAVPLGVHLRVLCDVLSGLHYAHELRDFDGAPLEVVHRDVSPQNVLVTFSGAVKVLDFGIAKGSFTPADQARRPRGKLRYMAPEQACDDAVDRRADVFCVGVMLWEVLANRRMWDGVEDVRRALARRNIPDVRLFAPDAPERLVEICRKALHPDRRQRYASALAMHHDLERYAQSAQTLVGTSELGEFLTAMFGDHKSRVRAAISSRLTDRAATQGSSEAPASKRPSFGPPTVATPSHSFVRWVAPSIPPEEEPSRRGLAPLARMHSTRTALIVALAAVLAVITAVALGHRDDGAAKPDVSTGAHAL